MQQSISLTNEYYIVITNNCNMNCKYCIGNDIIYGNHPTSNLAIDDLKSICQFINEENDINPHDINIVFYGGEPLLDQQAIKYIINNTREIKANYLLYTNGILLDSIDKTIRNKLRVILVSFDGVEELHNKYRMQGSFKLIKDQVNNFKKNYNGTLIGRITFMPDSNIYLAVKNSLKTFDAVYWQMASIQNDLIDNQYIAYQDGLKKLIYEWIRNIKKGIVDQIIPFQSIISSIIKGENTEKLKCGCGSTLKVINFNGDIYLCDEMIRMNEGKIGSIYSGIKKPETYMYEIDKCKNCEVNKYCGGRCLFMHQYYNNKKIEYYCSNTKFLITELLKNVKSIEKCISENIISFDQLDNFYSRNCTECIP